MILVFISIMSTEPTITTNDLIDDDILKDEDGIIHYGYPMNYFNPKTGKGPTTATEAAKWWPYRHDRPLKRTNAIDDVPDGIKMINEISQTRDSLRDYIIKELEQNFINNFKMLKITMTENNQTPQYGPDIKKK